MGTVAVVYGHAYPSRWNAKSCVDVWVAAPGSARRWSRVGNTLAPWWPKIHDALRGYRARPRNPGLPNAGTPLAALESPITCCRHATRAR